MKIFIISAKSKRSLKIKSVAKFKKTLKRVRLKKRVYKNLLTTM